MEAVQCPRDCNQRRRRRPVIVHICVLWAVESCPDSNHTIFTQCYIDMIDLLWLNGIFYRHEDLKTMLDSNRDNQKLEAMKRIVGVSIYM